MHTTPRQPNHLGTIIDNTPQSNLAEHAQIVLGISISFWSELAGQKQGQKMLK